MSTAQDTPEKSSYLLLSIFHGENQATIERYTDLPYHFLGHTSTPEMEVSIPKNSGALDAEEMEIDLPLDVFTTNLSNGLPHSPCYIQLTEVTDSETTGVASDQRRFWAGRIMRSIRNPEGRSDSVKLFVLSRKGRLKIAMGISCMHECPWSLFGYGCKEGISIDDFDEFGTIASVDGKLVTVNTSAITSKTGRYWRRGYLEFDGLRISVRDWSDTDPTKFYMARRVPDSWVTGSPSIHFVPGCDGSITTCRDVYGNEEFNGAIGNAMPPHNPNFQTT